MSDTGSSKSPVGLPLPADSAPAPSGSSRRVPVPSGPSTDLDQTVISQEPPVAPPASPAPFRPPELGKTLEGERLGHFELQQFVGGGGMGAVFRALDTRLARPVAVKILSREQAADEETLRRFKNEAQSAARLDHENIARVFFVGEDRGLHYIVFEFIDGVNVRDLVRRQGPLPLAEAVSDVLQLAEALSHTSSRDVVHRDIKPSNVIITPEGRAKLVDMGLARLHQVDRSGDDLTASGVTLGTFDYISPEQARDPRVADVRSDIYSLGCTFYFMLTGRPPFPDGTVLQKLLQHQGDAPPDLCQFRPELPARVPLIVAKMLAKDPADRYQQPRELVEALLLLADQIGLRPRGFNRLVPPAPVETGVSALQRHLPWAIPVAVLIVVVLFLDSVWSSSSRFGMTPPEPVTSSPRGSVAPEKKRPEPKNASPGKGGNASAPSPSPLREPATKPAVSSTVKKPAKPTPKPDNPPPPKAPQSPENDAAPDGIADSANPLARRLQSRPSGARLQPESSDGALSLDDGISAAIPSDSAEDEESGGLSGAADTPAPAKTAEPKPEQTSARTGTLVVGDAGPDKNEYPTLEAACAAARNGDVIKLRYDGRRVERPITLANLKVTIRAEEGYRPVIVFRPTDIDPVKSRVMLTVAGGQLTLGNLALELDLPGEIPAAENWSLVETQGAELVRLENSSLTIRNSADAVTAYHPDVAFFDVKSVPGESAVLPDTTDMADANDAVDRPIRIELQNCIARGEAVFVRSKASTPVRLVWENGLLATTEQFLVVAGGQTPPPHGTNLEIDLRHLTANVLGGLCLFTTSKDAPYPATTQITCSNSILQTRAASLFEQAGTTGSEDDQRRILWNGDRNFYEGFDVFWRVRNYAESTAREPMSFQAWQAFWGPEHENSPNYHRVIWKKPPPADRLVHQQAPSDYVLGDAPANPARAAASDGADAGLRADLLPPLPAPEKAPSPAAATDSPE
ncbi:MAG: serine/threonine-protein kinase [Pirellulales bacterium]